jgi:hypothetical protein
MIKVVICDGQGTVGIPSPTNEHRYLVDALPSLGMKLAVVSNALSRSTIEMRFHLAGLPQPDFIVARDEVLMARKPSPAFIRKLKELANVQEREMVYLGDDDVTDIMCAINAGILPFAAKYSEPSLQYGRPVHSPSDFLTYLQTFGVQDAPYFGWQCDFRCQDTGTMIDIRALYGNHDALGLTAMLKKVLKDQQDVRVGRQRISLRAILFDYLVSQIYLSGLNSEVDLVTVYPGHRSDSANPLLQQFSRNLSLIFRERFIPDLLIRHQNAAESKTQGKNRNIFEQFRTIHVNSTHRNKVVGKRVLILDDFTTAGYSLETARRMLLQGGAQKVTCIAIAKFRQRNVGTHITHQWDPFQPCTLTEHDIETFEISGIINTPSDDYFKNHIWAVYTQR